MFLAIEKYKLRFIKKYNKAYAFKAMKNSFTVNYKKDFVLIVSNGEKTIEFAREVIATAVKVCTTNSNYQILGISNTTKPVSLWEGYQYHEIFKEAGISYAYKIAWVEENSEFIDIYRFIETVLINRGLPGKVFTDTNEAKHWLLNN